MLKTSSDGRSGQSALAGLEKRLTGRVPDDSAVPGPVRKAVRFMLAGGAVTAVVGHFPDHCHDRRQERADRLEREEARAAGEFTSDVVGTVITYLIL